MKQEAFPGPSREFIVNAKIILSRIYRYLAAVATTLLLSSFVAAQAPPPAAHTTIYLHGRIYTNDPAHPWASAMAAYRASVASLSTEPSAASTPQCP